MNIDIEDFFKKKSAFISGLNCYSMLKHETLVLTLAAVEKIEEKLLFQMHRTDITEPKYDSRTALEFPQPQASVPFYRGS